MKTFKWDNEKNEWLKRRRKVSFEEAAFCIENDSVLAIIEHHNPGKYPEQEIAVLNINNYAYLVPYKIEEGVFVLKTMIPSRKFTKKYIGGKK